MTTPTENGWPRLLSFAGHELRNSLTVVAGYVRMLLKDRAGPLNDMQRRLLEETEKSCGRLSVLLSEMSDVAGIESGKTTFRSSAVDLRRVMTEAIESLPPLTDHPVDISLAATNGSMQVQGDEARLKNAFAALFAALRRELVTGNQLVVREREGEFRGKPAVWIAVGDPEHVEDLAAAGAETLTAFEECRGGSGLSLAVARRVVDAHGGAMWSPGQGTKAGAVVALPRP